VTKWQSKPTNQELLFPPLSPHDLVYLSTKNLDNFRSKLDKEFIGPFEVIETLSPVNI